MGPYCRFCNERCFVPFPDDTPGEAVKSYRAGINIIATCSRGQAFEKEATGWDYQRIVTAIAEQRAVLNGAAPDLLAALKKSVETIEALHGPVAWEIYRDNSPEMKFINAAIAKAEGRA